MPTISVDITVNQVTCEKVGCVSIESPANLIVVSAYRNEDGYMVANGTRLPEGWVRMIAVQEDGSETPFKVYCPTHAAEL